MNGLPANTLPLPSRKTHMNKKVPCARQASEGLRREDKGIQHHTPTPEASAQDGKVCDYYVWMISRFTCIYRKHAKVDATGIKSKPAELSQEDIEAAKKEWESIVLSESEDEM